MSVMIKNGFFYQDRDRDFCKTSLDIKTLSTFVKSVLISKHLGLQSLYWDCYQEFKDCSGDIKTGIKIFRMLVLILKLVLRLSGLQYWYWDWYWNYQDCSLNFETGIETFHISIPNRDWYQDFQNLNSLIETFIETFQIAILRLRQESRLWKLQSLNWH